MDGDSGSASQEPETSGLSTRPSSVGGNTGDSSSSSEGQVTSILSVLRAPTPSHLARKRKISCNPPPARNDARVAPTLTLSVLRP